MKLLLFISTLLICSMANAQSEPGCSIDLPSITFMGDNATLNASAKQLLVSISRTIKDNPECKIQVIGYCGNTKTATQRGWDRVNAVINYLVEKTGISGERFIFLYAQEGGDCNTVELRSTATGQGPSYVPAPAPHLRKN